MIGDKAKLKGKAWGLAPFNQTHWRCDMRIQVTAKDICSEYRKIFCADYCELQTLFEPYSSPYYHSGRMYGWNADYFTNDARSILFVTGYRTDAATHGYKKKVIDLSYEFVKAFEDKARAIVRDYGWKKLQERKVKMAYLKEEFWEALDNYTKEV